MAESGWQFFPAQAWRNAQVKHAVDSAKRWYGDDCGHLRSHGCGSPSMTRSSAQQCEVEAADLMSVACPYRAAGHPLECCLPGAESEMPRGCVSLCRRFCGCCHDALSPASVMAAQSLALPLQHVCLPPSPFMAHALGPHWAVAARLPSPLDHLRQQVDHTQAIETGELTPNKAEAQDEEEAVDDGSRRMPVHEALQAGDRDEDDDDNGDGDDDDREQEVQGRDGEAGDDDDREQVRGGDDDDDDGNSRDDDDDDDGNRRADDDDDGNDDENETDDGA